ncbi:MAG: phosphonate C-P lyase system protein PhnH [Allorhizobium sp.]
MSLLSHLKADPFQTQQTAREVIAAMSYPGRILAPGLLTPALFVRSFGPVGTRISMTTQARAMIDEVPLGLRHTGIPEAGLVVATGSEIGALSDEIPRGSLSHPEEGALVLILVDVLDAGLPPDAAQNGTLRFSVTGPGVNGARGFTVRGLTDNWAARRAQANAEFPMGYDCVLLARDGAAIGLPRLARLEQ